MHNRDLWPVLANSGAVLVLAPHPDDECLGAAGLMKMAADAGQEVHVLMLTSGDGFVQDAQRYYLSLSVSPEEYLHLGYERQKETISALTSLGVARDHIYFLGFPDGGVDALYRTHWSKTFESSTTTWSRVPYLEAAAGPLSYQGRWLWQSICTVVQRIRPRLLVMPHPLDGHPDHWATHSFGRLAALGLEEHSEPEQDHATVLTYLIHWPAWPMPLGLKTRLEQEPPPGLIQTERLWRQLRLTPPAIQAKQHTMTVYTSQMELIKPYMLAFVRSTETFEEDGARLVVNRQGRDPGSPDRGWPNETTVAFRAPAEDLVTRMAKSPNVVESLEVSQSDGYGYLRLRWLRRREPDEFSIVIRMHWPDGSAPWQWCFDLSTSSVSGNAEEALTVKVDHSARELSASWPLEVWQGRRWMMLGAEALHDERVLGRSGYLPYHWS